MKTLGIVEDTLFVPMAGRIYASEHCREILYDEKALSLKDRLPEEVLRYDGQSQYTLIASAVRSANMDRYIRDFLKRKPGGVIVQLGCGLETAYYRNENGKTRWYAVDLPDVIAYRKTLLPESERESYIMGDARREDWLKQIRAMEPEAPVLVTAAGLFYYFHEEEVLGILRMLRQYGNVELVFDAVSRRGMRMMQKKYMKQVGHADAGMFFYVDSAETLTSATGGDIRVLTEEPYYISVDGSSLRLETRLSMWISDRMGMVKMIHLQIL